MCNHSKHTHTHTQTHTLDTLLHVMAGGQSLLGFDWPAVCKYLEEAEGSTVRPVATGDGSPLIPQPLPKHTHTHTHTHSSPVSRLYSHGHRVERINHTHTQTHTHCRVDIRQGVDMSPLLSSTPGRPFTSPLCRFGQSEVTTPPLAPSVPCPAAAATRGPVVPSL